MKDKSIDSCQSFVKGAVLGTLLVGAICLMLLIYPPEPDAKK